MCSTALALRPNYEELEPFSEYFNRVNPLLPNFPECVLRQWFFDHFTSAVSRYSWLDFDKLIFRQESWPSENILSSIKAWNELAVESWKNAFIRSPERFTGSLVDFMRQNKTWPVPPLVLDNSEDLSMPDKTPIARWELIEGHHRLAYFRALHMKANTNLPETHCIWLVAVNK